MENDNNVIFDQGTCNIAIAEPMKGLNYMEWIDVEIGTTDIAGISNNKENQSTDAQDTESIDCMSKLLRRSARRTGSLLRESLNCILNKSDDEDLNLDEKLIPLRWLFLFMKILKLK